MKWIYFVVIICFFFSCVDAVQTELAEHLERIKEITPDEVVYEIQQDVIFAKTKKDKHYQLCMPKDDLKKVSPNKIWLYNMTTPEAFLQIIKLTDSLGFNNHIGGVFFDDYPHSISVVINTNDRAYLNTQNYRKKRDGEWQFTGLIRECYFCPKGYQKQMK